MLFEFPAQIIFAHSDVFWNLIQILEKMAQGMGNSQENVEGGGAMGASPEVIQAMMAAMPIKSLVSFSGGALDADVLIAAFNKCLEN